MLASTAAKLTNKMTLNWIQPAIDRNLLLNYTQFQPRQSILSIYYHYGFSLRERERESKDCFKAIITFVNSLISRGKPVLSFSKKLLRYQNSNILWCLDVSAFSNLYMYIRSLQVNLFLFQDCFYIKLLIIMFFRMFDIQY